MNADTFHEHLRHLEGCINATKFCKHLDSLLYT